MTFPPRWVDTMTYEQIRAAWHGVYCERARDNLYRAEMLFAHGDRQTGRQVMGYAREDGANARHEYQEMLKCSQT